MQRRLAVVSVIGMLAFLIHGLTTLKAANSDSSDTNNSVRYLVDADDLPKVAARYGLDEEALERLERAHHHLEEHQAKPKPDPVETNGEVFLDKEGKTWPKPDAAIMFTGDQIGYLEPCGCAGLENQKGGLKRRHTLVKYLRDELGWPIALFDSGEQIRYFGPQAEIKQRQSLEALIQIGYDAVGFGPRDLRTDLLGTIINFPDENKNPLTSANVGIIDFESGFTKSWRVVEVGNGIRIGVTSVLGDKARSELGESEDTITIPAEQALTQLLPTIEKSSCDQNVLMVYGNAKEASALAKKFDKFDWVVAGTGSDEPMHIANKIEGTKRGGGSVLIEVGHKGMYAVVVGLYRKPGTHAAGEGWVARYQKTPIDHRWADSPDMQQRLVEYQAELESLGWEGLGLRPMPHPTGKTYAGSAICGDCHTAAWDAFVDTPHFHTTETLLALNPPRHFDPECISCHAVGWEPQKYFPLSTGWIGYETTSDKFSQGCENCHGPAARHAAVELGDIEVTEEEEQALRDALHMEIVENEGNMSEQVLGDAVENCMQCHDLDNSPDFDFQEYWLEVAHEGVD